MFNRKEGNFNNECASWKSSHSKWNQYKSLSYTSERKISNQKPKQKLLQKESRSAIEYTVPNEME